MSASTASGNKAEIAAQARIRFEAALDELIEEARRDDHILAAILCGSLAYDEVWDKSDIDLFLIATDDKNSRTRHVSLAYDDVNIHTTVQPRAEFKRQLESSIRNTFGHSMFARAKLLYTRDPTIEEIFSGLVKLGDHDRRQQMMHSAQHALSTHYKALKWHRIKDDPTYTALWTLQTAVSLAEIEVSRHGRLVDRESLLEALKLNPSFFSKIYTNILEGNVSESVTGEALDAIDDYLESQAEDLFEPILEYLRDARGEPRTDTEISHYFSRHFQLSSVLLACEYLSDIGLIEKATSSVKLTTRSQVNMEELAFFVIPEW